MKKCMFLTNEKENLCFLCVKCEYENPETCPCVIAYNIGVDDGAQEKIFKCPANNGKEIFCRCCGQQ